MSNHTPTPVPSEVAETTAGEEEVNIIQRIVNAWDCCGTCAGGVLAAHDRATADRVRREEGEKVLREAADDWDELTEGPRRILGNWLRDRAASIGRGEGL